MIISHQQISAIERNTNNNSFGIDPINQKDIKNYYDEFIKYCDATDATIKTYRKALNVLFKYLIAHHADKQPIREDLITFRKDLEAKGLQATTIASYINATKQFFKWLSIEGYYNDIAQHIKSAKVDNTNYRKDPLTKDQVNKVLAYAETKTTTNEGLRNYAILELAFTSGLRTIEIVRADIKDIMIKNNVLVLAIQGKGKQDKNTYISISDDTKNALDAYLATRKNTNSLSPLFASESDRNNGERLTTTSISRIIKNAFKAIGLNAPNLTAHSTRHTFATTLFDLGYSLDQVRTLMRHSNINTTMIYTHTKDKLDLKGEQTLSNAFNAYKVKNTAI